MSNRNRFRQQAITHIAGTRPLDKKIDYQNEPLQDIFGELVFDEDKMRSHLPQGVFSKLLATIRDGLPLDQETADAVANSMKEWAVRMGATHYSHWFQPMTGLTAEKHDSFLSPSSGGKILTNFQVKCLLKVNQTHRHSLLVAFALPLKRADTPRGIHGLLYLLKIA